MNNTSFSGLRGCLTTQTARRQTSLACCQMQDIPGSVDIPVLGVSARAYVDAIRERFPLLRFTPAVTTDLGRSSRIHSDDHTASLFSSVAQRSQEAGPARITHRTGEHTTGKASDVQVFDSYQIVPSNQIKSGFAVEVAPHSLDAAVLPCEDLSPLAAVGATLPLFRDGALGPTHLRISCNKRSWVHYEFPVAGGEEGSKADINADVALGDGQGFLGNALAREGNPPITTSITFERDRLWPTFQWPREVESGSADALHCESSAIELAATAYSPCERVVTETGAKARIARCAPRPAAAVEGREGEIDSLENVEQYLGADLAEFRSQLLQPRHLSGLREVAYRHAALPRLSAVLNSCVVELTAQGELPLGLTNSGGGESNFVLKRASHHVAKSNATNREK